MELIKDLVTTFHAERDSVETDPRPRWYRMLDQVIDRVLGPRAQIPESIAADLLRSQLRELGPRLDRALQSGNVRDGDEAISEVQAALLESVRRERTSGRLVPVCAETELERNKQALTHYRWDGGAERNALLAMIKDGERIKSINFWSITTDKREIMRDDARRFLKPRTWSTSGTWESQFTSDADVRDAEEAASRREYAPGSDSRNLDLPNPKRI
jgi:hypothetical protein